MSQAMSLTGAVPYITQWTGESPSKVRVVERRGRVAYADERSYDRDPRGILWRRIPSTPGKGKPDFGAVHALRQRLAMANTLCQGLRKARRPRRAGNPLAAGRSRRHPGLLAPGT
ncbi:hypothetical protein GCM10010232_58980 [Streptomyces amakusaensis]